MMMVSLHLPQLLLLLPCLIRHLLMMLQLLLLPQFMMLVSLILLQLFSLLLSHLSESVMLLSAWVDDVGAVVADSVVTVYVAADVVFLGVVAAASLAVVVVVEVVMTVPHYTSQYLTLQTELRSLPASPRLHGLLLLLLKESNVHNLASVECWADVSDAVPAFYQRWSTPRRQGTADIRGRLLTAHSARYPPGPPETRHSMAKAGELPD